MYAKIQPVSYRIGEATCLVVRNISVQLNDRAAIEWSLLSDRTTGVSKDFESGSTQLTGDDYNSWSNDDTYIYTWLANQLSLVVTSIEPDNYWSMP